MTNKTAKTGLDLLRVPFEEHQISKKPKPTQKQTNDLKSNYDLGIRCKLCGQWHHKDAIHLDYVGHAALTDRLLECDINWNWEPVAFNQHGTPTLDQSGGMWIKLTVCGQTRLGYGHPDGKSGGDAIKETIGDALRNAAMRFGAALDLWHKGDLHAPEDDDGNEASKAGQKTQQPKQQAKQNQKKPEPTSAADLLIKELEGKISSATTVAAVEQIYTDNKDAMNAMLSGDQKVAVIKKMAARKEAVGNAEANPFEGVQND